jgi:four helix bundle protein
VGHRDAHDGAVAVAVAVVVAVAVAVARVTSSFVLDLRESAPPLRLWGAASLRPKTKEEVMFIALQVSIELVRNLREVAPVIRRRSRSLGDQLIRAADSAALNLIEGAKREGGDRRYHYTVAEGSAAEARAAVALAEAWGHVEGVELTHVHALFDRQARLLHGLTHPRRG